MKNTKILAPVVIIILILGFGFYSLVLNKSTVTPKEEPQQKEKQIKVLEASDLGLTLKPRADKRAVEMSIAKLSGISSIEYEVQYDAEVTDEGQTNKVPRGVVNSPIEVKPTDTEITREVLMGTCSKNVCKYDNVVSDVTFTFKVNYTNGEIGGLEEKISL